MKGLDARIRVVVSANFIAVAARMSLVTFLGIYFVRDAGIELATVGLAFLAENLLRGVLAPVFGALSDRVGRRPLLIAGVLATAAILPGFLLVQGPASLFAWSIALGLAGAIGIPVSSALLLDLAPAERRQYVLAVNYTLMSVGYAVGVMPAGYVAERGYGWLALGAAAGYLLVGALYVLALRGPLPLERRRDEESVLRNLASVATDRTFIAFAALAFIFPLGIGLVVFASPLFGADEGLGEGFIGLVLGGNSVLVALVAVPVAARIEPMGPFRLLGAAGLLLAACFASFAFVPNAAFALLAGTIVFSLGEVIFSSAVPAAVARLAPAGRRGAYQGAWTLVHSFTTGSALLLSGLLRDAIGWRATWVAYAALTLALALVLLRRYRAR
jgi:MFS family permease